MGFGCWAVFEFGRDSFGFCPLSGFAISPAVGRESGGGRAEGVGFDGGTLLAYGNWGLILVGFVGLDCGLSVQLEKTLAR